MIFVASLRFALITFTARLIQLSLNSFVFSLLFDFCGVFVVLYQKKIIFA